MGVSDGPGGATVQNSESSQGVLNDMDRRADWAHPIIDGELFIIETYHRFLCVVPIEKQTARFPLFERGPSEQLDFVTRVVNWLAAVGLVEPALMLRPKIKVSFPHQDRDWRTFRAPCTDTPTALPR